MKLKWVLFNGMEEMVEVEGGGGGGVKVTEPEGTWWTTCGPVYYYKYSIVRLIE